MKRLIHLMFLFVLVGLDQITKLAVRTNLANGKEITIISGWFKFVFHKNDGAIWGIMSGKTGLLTVMTILILILMLWFYVRIPQTKRFLPLQLIVVFITAGAVGNLIDRIVFGYVTDFIYFELIDFPVFNIADCYITVSSFLLLFLVLFFYKEEEIDRIFTLKSRDKREGK